MKMFFEFEVEENQTNIGIAKAMTEVGFLSEADLCEIAKYLLVYTEARSTEKLLDFQRFERQKGCEPQ